MVLGIVVFSVLIVLPLRWLNPATTAFMLQDDSGAPLRHEWVDWDGIGIAAKLAVVAAEDQRFAEHFGIDIGAIHKAVKEQDERGYLRGASTITQQTAKNLFLWSGRSFGRKGLEAWFTVWLEQVWSKRRILEAYLNVAQFGPCLFGAGAASDRYFNTEAIALSAQETALLATVLPNPKRLRAGDPGPYARERSAEILALMNWHRDKAIGMRFSKIISGEN